MNKLPFKALNYRISVFNHLNLYIFAATHNFKGVKISIAYYVHLYFYYKCKSSTFIV